MKGPSLPLAVLLALAVLPASIAAAAKPHNVILFVPDGLRTEIVDYETAPALARLRDRGVDFADSHSLFPTFTTANASAFATGHRLGDTGDFSNALFAGFPVSAAGGSVTPFLESDPVLVEVNEHFAGNYLNEESILAAARAKGYSTAAIGKLGPVAIFDLGSLKGDVGGGATLIVDDTTGHGGGIPLADSWLEAIKAAGIATVTPGRGDNGNPGDYRARGTLVPNVAQQQFFLELTMKVVLPRFKAAGKPFVLVYWSRDPDGTQHNQGDSPGALIPGINGPTSMSAIRACDAALAAIERSLRTLGLQASTDIVVAADHGFSTISKSSASSPAAKFTYSDVKPGTLPPGFLAIDLAEGLQQENAALRLFDPDAKNAVIDFRNGAHPIRGHGVIASDVSEPLIIIAANGGSDLVYLPPAVAADDAHDLAAQVIQILLRQDYVSGLFVDTGRLGEFPGTLPLSAVDLDGSARTPRPSIVVNFASFGTGCVRPSRCAAEVADTSLQQGQGMHGSFSRADTWNFMAARGPDFRRAYRSTMPASNADIGMTIAHLLQLDLPSVGQLRGRVLSESLWSGRPQRVLRETILSSPAANGLQTILKVERVGSASYFDVAGFAGRSVGLDAR
jgi:hypothetical protein